MPLWLQNLIVFATIDLCALFALRQFIHALRTRKGGCCSRGCSPATPASGNSQRIVFIPLESLSRPRRR